MASKYRKKYTMPEGFYKILEDYSREVIRDQPKDIVEFSYLYFKHLEEVFISYQFLLYIYIIIQTIIREYFMNFHILTKVRICHLLRQICRKCMKIDRLSKPTIEINLINSRITNKRIKWKMSNNIRMTMNKTQSNKMLKNNKMINNSIAAPIINKTKMQNKIHLSKITSNSTILINSNNSFMAELVHKCKFNNIKMKRMKKQKEMRKKSMAKRWQTAIKIITSKIKKRCMGKMVKEKKAMRVNRKSFLTNMEMRYHLKKLKLISELR